MQTHTQEQQHITSSHNLCYVTYVVDLMSALKLIGRQLRGEELQELSLDQLKQLEKSIEEGLVRVSEAKVWSYDHSIPNAFPSPFCFSLASVKKEMPLMHVVVDNYFFPLLEILFHHHMVKEINKTTRK